MTEPLPAWEGESGEVWAGRLGVRTVEVYEVIDSTNRRGREVAGRPELLPAVVLADRQTHGQGRMGRPWVSNTAEGLWFSVVLASSAEVPVLSLLAGVAVARSIDGLGGTARIKWPNDVLVSDRKVAGVLSAHSGPAVVVGIGINVNHAAGSLPQGTDPPAGSLRLALGRSVPRGPLLTGVMGHLFALMGTGDQLGPALLEEVNERSIVRGVRLAATGTVRHSTGALAALERAPATGGCVRRDGTLELTLDGGETMVLIAGSIRALE